MAKCSSLIHTPQANALLAISLLMAVTVRQCNRCASVHFHATTKVQTRWLSTGVQYNRWRQASEASKQGPCLGSGSRAAGRTVADELPIAAGTLTGHLGSAGIHWQPDCECRPLACTKSCPLMLRHDYTEAQRQLVDSGDMCGL